MASIKTAQQIQTGPAGTIKGDSINLSAETIKADKKAETEAKAQKLSKGEVRYRALGANNFSSANITFGGKLYITGKVKEQEELDEFVERGFLAIDEDAR